MWKRIIPLVGVLLFLLLIVPYFSEAQKGTGEATTLGVAVLEVTRQPNVNFTSEVAYAEAVVGNLEFSERSSGKRFNLEFIGKDAEDRDVLPSEIPEFRVNVDSSSPSLYKWSYEFRLPDEKFVPQVWVTGDSVRVVDSKYAVVNDKYVVSFEDILEHGFTYELRVSDSQSALFLIYRDWVADGFHVGDLITIDPVSTGYPTQDGELERDEFGVFNVYLTGTTITVGSNVAVTDVISRGYYRFNTSIVDPYDTIINATFWARVSSETCGSAAADVWLQNISNYGDLGESDWDIGYQNISVYYNTTTNGTGFHAVNITNWITKGGMSFYRLQSTYEQYNAVDCFINVNSNESANEPYIEIWWTDGVADLTPPNVMIVAPQNTTYYDLPVLPLNVIGYDTNNITAWIYSLNGAGNVSFIPNTTFVPINGSNNITVWAMDSFGNWGENVSYFTYMNNVPVIIIHSPQNTTYFHCPIDLNVSASESISTWIYSVNGDGNVTFIPNTTITVLHCGMNILNVYANDSTGLWGVSNVIFNVTMVMGNATLDGISLYYSPYVLVGDDVMILALVESNGLPYNESQVEVALDNMTANMLYNETLGMYEIMWIPSASGVYNISVIAITNSSNLTTSGFITVLDDFICIDVKLWTNVTMPAGSEYKNEFAWVYAVRDVDSHFAGLWGHDTFQCAPQGIPECFWHGKYVNGTAHVCLPDDGFTGNYSLFMVGNNINFQQDIGSGVYVEECQNCKPDAIKQTMNLPLGTYHFDTGETLDLYFNPAEMAVTGGLLGWATAPLGLIFIGIIAVVFFFIVLIFTGSLTAALAALVLLPTIVMIFIGVIMGGF